MILFILLSMLTGEIYSPAIREPAPQQSRPPWFVVFEEKAAQGDRVQFLMAQKKAVDAWKQHNPDLPVLAWQNDDNTLYRVVPIFSFASIDTLYNEMQKVSEILKAGRRHDEQQPENTSTASASVMVWEPAISHHPEAEFSLYPGKPFTQWMFIYLLSGREDAAMVALKNFRDYYANKKLDYHWEAFRVLLGNETPLIIGMFHADSPAALQDKGDRIWKKHSEQLHLLWEEVVRCTWKIENKTGWFNQSLSNVPEIQSEERVAGGF